MKKYLVKIIQNGLLLWLNLSVGIIATSFLYAILIVLGVNKNISFVIAFSILSTLIILIFLVPQFFLTAKNFSNIYSSYANTFSRSHSTHYNHLTTAVQNMVMSPTIIVSPKSIKVSCLYSYKDTNFCKMLEDQLKSTTYEITWHDHQIELGDIWKDKIVEDIEKSGIVLLLVSPDLVQAEQLSSFEIIHALEKYKDKNTSVIPVICRASDWKRTELGKFQPLPANEEPVISWSNQNEAITNITDGIKKIIKENLAF